MYETIDRTVELRLREELNLAEFGRLPQWRYRIRVCETLVEIADLVQKQTSLCWLENLGDPPSGPPMRIRVASLATLLAASEQKGEAPWTA